MSTNRDDIPKWRVKPRKTPRALLRSILMLDDTPHSVALGTAVGMFVGLTPTVGVQMLIVLAIAFLVRPLFQFNKVAAVLTVYVTNPLTAIPVYWFNYQIGTYFVPSDVKYEDFVAIVQIDQTNNWSERALSLITHLGAPLLVGCLVVATVSSLLTYPAMRWLIRRYLNHEEPSLDEVTPIETLVEDQQTAKSEAAANQHS
ncbi:MAG: DUF2062 domain-containing protein [Planctomycetota bacterium]|nr:DUF2062 domain-containing protein [Planctomycetota bacterium]MDA1164574.1 DUF2062 domain-containing protein [Planctomycetota bacterium]